MISMSIAKSKDADELSKLYYQCWCETYPAILGENSLKKVSVEQFAEQFRKTRCRDIILGRLDNHLVGFCSYGPCREEGSLKDTGEVYGVYVLNAYKKQGEGRRLLHEAIRQLRRDEYNTVEVWILEDNSEAVAFYEALGFISTDKTRRYAPRSSFTERCYFRNI